MKKKLALVLMAMLLVGVLTGCQSAEVGTSDVKASMTMGELAEKILSEVEFAMTMPVDLNNAEEMSYLGEVTGLTPDLVKDSSLNVNMMVSADNLWLAEASSPENVAKVQEAFEKQKASVVQSFEQYLPEPLEVAKKGEVVTKGNYVMLVISQDNSKVIDSFNEAIK